MNITRWNPFHEMDDLFKSYNHALSRNHFQEGLQGADWSPSVDITENDKEFLIKAELPEVKKEDIQINVSHGALSISGERKSETKDMKEHRIERFYGHFVRSFSLPENVNEDDITAENKDGMLYLHLPKSVTESPKEKRIDIH